MNTYLLMTIGLLNFEYKVIKREIHFLYFNNYSFRINEIHITRRLKIETLKLLIYYSSKNVSRKMKPKSSDIGSNDENNCFNWILCAKLINCFSKKSVSFIVNFKCIFKINGKNILWYVIHLSCGQVPNTHGWDSER